MPPTPITSVDTDYPYRGRVLTIKRKHIHCADRVTRTFEIIECPSATAIVAVTSDQKIVMEHHYRAVAERAIWEIPAGKLDAGESPEHAACRELEEETGLRAGQLTKLYSGFVSPGYTEEIMHFFLATQLEKTAVRRNDDEWIDVNFFSLSEINKMISEGLVEDNKTVLGVLLVSAHLAAGR